jgi:hypothetical protein
VRTATGGIWRVLREGSTRPAGGFAVARARAAAGARTGAGRVNGMRGVDDRRVRAT